MTPYWTFYFHYSSFMSWLKWRFLRKSFLYTLKQFYFYFATVLQHHVLFSFRVLVKLSSFLVNLAIFSLIPLGGNSSRLSTVFSLYTTLSSAHKECLWINMLLINIGWKMNKWMNTWMGLWFEGLTGINPKPWSVLLAINHWDILVENMNS